MYVYNCFTCMYVCVPCACGSQQQDWNYRWLGTTMWVLGSELRSSARAVGAVFRLKTEFLCV